MDGGLDGWMTDRRQKAEEWDGWMNRMGFPAETDGRQKQEGRIGKEETAKWKQDIENRKGELGIRKKTMNEKLGLRLW